MAERAFDDMQRRDAEFFESTRQLVTDAIRAGREPPDFKKLHAILYRDAETILKDYWDKKGQKARATKKVEEFRRDFLKATRKEWSKRGQKAWVKAKLEEFKRELVAIAASKSGRPAEGQSAI